MGCVAVSKEDCWPLRHLGSEFSWVCALCGVFWGRRIWAGKIRETEIAAEVSNQAGRAYGGPAVQMQEVFPSG